MGKGIANEKMAEKAKKIKTDNENIENHKSLNKNELEELVHREVITFTELFHLSMKCMRIKNSRKKSVLMLV